MIVLCWFTDCVGGCMVGYLLCEFSGFGRFCLCGFGDLAWCLAWF